MGVSLNGGTPKTPKWSFLVGKPMVVGETHHFRKPPYTSPMDASREWFPHRHVPRKGMLLCYLSPKAKRQWMTFKLVGDGRCVFLKNFWGLHMIFVFYLFGDKNICPLNFEELHFVYWETCFFLTCISWSLGCVFRYNLLIAFSWNFFGLTSLLLLRWCCLQRMYNVLGGGFMFLFSSIFGEMIQFD